MADRARPLTLLLADDHAVWRDCVADLLRRRGFEIAGEVGDVPSLAARLSQLPVPPDVLLMDVQMPGGGPSALAALLASHPALRVLVLSTHEEPAIVGAMLAAGACGYLSKDDAIEDLAAAIRAVAAGLAPVGSLTGLSRPLPPSQQ